MNSRTDFANTHDTGRRLETETAVQQNHHLRRAALRAAVPKTPKTPTLPSAVVAVLMQHAALAGTAFNAAVFRSEWTNGASPVGLELGRFKSAALRAADRAMVGVRIGPDGDVDALPVDLTDSPSSDPSAVGSVRATVERAFFRQKVRPLALRAAVPTRRPSVDSRRRHPFRLPAATHGCATPADW